MPKIRSKKSVLKRIKVTGSGKIKRMRQFSGCHHIREKKSPKRTRKFRKQVVAHESNAKNLRRCVPYAV